MTVTIRNAAPVDLAAITEIYRESVLNGVGTYELDAPSLAEMTARYDAITAKNYPYIVAVNEENIVLGYAYANAFRARPAYRYICEDSIYVSPLARGQNVGRLLLEELIARSTHLGLRQMVAVIGGANPASVAVHKKTGFVHTGRMPASGLKFGQWQDTVLMQLALGEGLSTVPTAEPGIRSD